MAGSRFVLSAQVMLQRPTQANLTAVSNDIRRALDKGTLGITKQVDVKVNSQQLRQSIALIAQLNKQLQQTVTINQNISNSARGFSTGFGGIPGLTTSIFGLVNILAVVKSVLVDAAKSAIEFNDSMVKVKQITGQSYNENRAFTNSVYAIATATGASIESLGQVAVRLNSTGMAASEVKENLKTLAELSLTANFKDFNTATEQAVLLFQSFHASSAEIRRDLEINAALANKFGVSESELARGFKYIAAQAKEAGISYADYAKTVTHASVQSGESIERNALGFKTIIEKLKTGDLKKSLRDNFNIDTHTASVALRPATQILEELSQKVQGLGKGEPLTAALEQKFGLKNGPKLLAFVEDYNKKLEISNATEDAQNTIAREQSDALDKVTTQWNRLTDAISNFLDTTAEFSGINTLIKSSLAELTSYIQKVTTLLNVNKPGGSEALISLLTGGKNGAVTPTLVSAPEPKRARPLEFEQDPFNRIAVDTGRANDLAVRLRSANAARNLGPIDTRHFQGPESAALSNFENRDLNSVAFRVRAFGDKTLPSNLPPLVAKELQNALESVKSTSSFQDITKALKDGVAQLKESFNARDAANKSVLDESLAGRRNFFDAQLSADKARSTFGGSNAAANIGFSGDPAQLGVDIRRSQARALTINQQLRDDTISSGLRIKLNEQLADELHHTDRLNQALKLLATSTGSLQKQFEHTARERQRLQPQLALNERLAFGSIQDRFKIQETLNLADRLGSGTLSSKQLSHKQLEDVHELASSFGNSQSHLFGDKTGAQLIGQIIKEQGFGDTNLKLSNEEARLEIATQSLHVEQEKAQLEEQLLELWKQTIAGSNVAPLGATHKATGGYIRGPSGKDKVPAMLTAGEYVIKKAAVERIGVGTLQRLNGGGEIHNPLNKYADGGAVDFEALGRAAKEREDAQAARNAELRSQNASNKAAGNDAQYSANVAARTLASQNNTAAIIAQRGANQNAAAIVAQNRAASTPTGLTPSEQFRLGRYGYAPPTKSLPQFETFNGQGSIFGQSPFAGYKLPVERVANNRIVEERQPRDTGASVANTFQPYKNQDVRQLAAHRGLSVDTSGLVSATQKLSEVITSLNGLSLDAKFSGSLEVVVNGGAVLQDLGPKFEELARAQVEKGITELIEKKFPNVGGMNYKQRDNDAQQKGQ